MGEYVKEKCQSSKKSVSHRKNFFLTPIPHTFMEP